MSWWRHPVVGAVLVTALVAGVMARGRSDAGTGALEVAERWTLDARFSLRGPVGTSGQVALVVLDDETATRHGPLLERRAGFAQVVRALKAAGAKVIGIDAVFEVPERLLEEGLAQRVRAWREAQGAVDGGSAADGLLREVASELDGDAVLASALEEAGNVVLILHATLEGASTVEPASLSRARYVQSVLGEVPPPTVSTFSASLPLFHAASRAQGFASVAEDDTRTVRRFALARLHEGSVYFPFAVPVVAQARGVGRGQLAYLGREGAVALGEERVPLQGDHLWLNYRGPERTFPTFSAAALVEGRVPAGALAGKAVLLGITRLGYDVARTPFESMPGVEVQATAIDNLLQRDWLVRSTPAQDLVATLGLGLLVALLFSTARLGLRAQVVGTVVVVAAWLLGTGLLFAWQRQWWPWLGPVTAALASGVVGLVASYAGEAVQRRHLKKAFGHYLGEEALEALLAHPGALRLGGERRTLTVLFSDIRDFTTLSEHLPPEKLVAFLNAYLSPMTRAVLRQGGLLDKYIGDAVMAVFGAPTPRADHADMALRCVQEMHAELAALNAGPLQALGPRIDIGVGLNTGDMVAGNMGSEERYDYTVVGDAVNLASRLEGLTKKYGVFCLVGQPTRAAAASHFLFRELDLVQVKGKHEAVAVWEFLGTAEQPLARYAEAGLWETGLAAWRAGQLPEARQALSAFARANPDDGAAALYLDRLEELPAEAPPGWSPVAVFTSK